MKKAVLPPDMLIDMSVLLNNPQDVSLDIDNGLEQGVVKSITKYIQKEGSGLLPSQADRLIYNLEIRYSNGYIYDFSSRNEQKRAVMDDDKMFKFFLASISSMRSNEVSIFKIQFEDESQNHYLKTEHAKKFLNEEKLNLIEDKTSIFMKLTLCSIIRDVKDKDVSQLNDIKTNSVEFIKDRYQFGKECKDHATIALTEGSLNDAMKIYRKGQGAMKMVSKNILKDAKDDLKDNKEEEAKLDTILEDYKVVQVSLMLNQGLCHQKQKEWEKMKKVNEDILRLFDSKNIKAMYRLALACKELECHQQGLVRVKLYKL